MTSPLYCPFCGPGNSIVEAYYDDVAHRYRVGCGRCGASSGTSPRATGDDGSEGISVVLDRRTPSALSRTMASYRAQRDVFHPTAVEKNGFAAFNAWYRAPLETAL